MALNENVEIENNAIDTPSIEQTTEEVVDTPSEATEATADEATQEETNETEGSSHKGENYRIRELNAAKKAAEERANALEERMANMVGGVPNNGGYNLPQQNLEPIINPGEEIDAVEFDRRLKAREENILQRADALVQLRTKQSEAIGRITGETQEVIREFPELDPKSDSFNKELSDAITEATEAYVSKNPYSASVKQFVAKMMKPYKGAVSKEVGQVKETLAKQVSQSAIRPTSIKQIEKTAREKTIAELENELGVVQS